MTQWALSLGAACIAFGPSLALFSLLVYHKAPLVIVVTTAAFFFLCAAVLASLAWSLFYQVGGFDGPMASILPGVVAQFMGRCALVALYHQVEAVIHTSLQKHEQQLEEEQQQQQDHHRTGGHNHDPLPREEAQQLRLQMNDVSSGIAAGVGYGGMHALLLYGTLWASEISNNVGILYQESCPSLPSLVVSALLAFFFSILDIFWMLFTFFGMRRRGLYHRGEGAERQVHGVGGWLGNSRSGGNLALLFALASHLTTAVLTTSDLFPYGCVVSLTAVAIMVLVTAYVFWAGCGRIYLPPAPPGLTMMSPVVYTTTNTRHPHDSAADSSLTAGASINLPHRRH